MNDSQEFFTLDIKTKDVLEAQIQNGILNFKPGLVGGHCIGVDPYYLTYIQKNMVICQIFDFWKINKQ